MVLRAVLPAVLPPGTSPGGSLEFARLGFLQPCCPQWSQVVYWDQMLRSLFLNVSIYNLTVILMV